MNVIVGYLMSQNINFIKEVYTYGILFCIIDQENRIK